MRDVENGYTLYIIYIYIYHDMRDGLCRSAGAPALHLQSFLLDCQLGP